MESYATKNLTRLNNWLVDGGHPPLPAAEASHILRELQQLQERGATEQEAFAYCRNFEEVSPDLEEETALKRMQTIRAAVEVRTGKSWCLVGWPAAEPPTPLPKAPGFHEFAEHVKEWAESNDFRFMDNYSGRGMYGKKCLAVVVPSFDKIADLYFQFGWQCAEAAADGAPGAQDPQTPRGFQYDNMGHDWVIYWPRMTSTDL